MAQFLFAAQIPLRRLNRRVSEQKLNLLQFARLMTKVRTSTPQVVRRDVWDLGPSLRRPYNMPNRFGRNAFAPDFADSVNTTEQTAVLPAD